MTMDTDDEDGKVLAAENSDINLVTLNGATNEVGMETNAKSERKEKFGLLSYTPNCFRNAFLSVYGILFFLCWASTIQVSMYLR